MEYLLCKLRNALGLELGGGGLGKHHLTIYLHLPLPRYKSPGLGNCPISYSDDGVKLLSCVLVSSRLLCSMVVALSIV